MTDAELILPLPADDLFLDEKGASRQSLSLPVLLRSSGARDSRHSPSLDMAGKPRSPAAHLSIENQEFFFSPPACFFGIGYATRTSQVESSATGESPDQAAGSFDEKEGDRGDEDGAGEAHEVSQRKRMKIRVMVVDDHKMFREGLRALISGEPDMEVVGEAADGREAIEMARKLAPDVVVMDMKMPVMSGIDATRNLVKEMPGMRVLVLSMYSSDHLSESVLEAGASGYVLKGCDFEELAAAIRCVCQDSRPLSAKIH